MHKFIVFFLILSVIAPMLYATEPYELYDSEKGDYILRVALGF